MTEGQGFDTCRMHTMRERERERERERVRFYCDAGVSFNFQVILMAMVLGWGVLVLFIATGKSILMLTF